MLDRVPTLLDAAHLGLVFIDVLGNGEVHRSASSVRVAQSSRPIGEETRMARLQLGREVTVDLQANAYFNENGGRPCHDHLLSFRRRSSGFQITVLRFWPGQASRRMPVPEHSQGKWLQGVSPSRRAL